MMRFRRIVGSVAAAAALALASGVSVAAPEPAELAKIEADGYVLEVKDATTAVGKEATVSVTLKAKAGFKVNEKYPIKLSLDANDALELPKSELKREDGKEVDKQTFTFNVALKAKSAGKHALKGKIKLSVCNESQCLIDKKDIVASVVAK